ncbi:hypothetical protein ERJ75_000415900 [Trypanosoma vivax]|nr:hypothetical protein ERJ75_000415900 [Trypanosoma vivax]
MARTVFCGEFSVVFLVLALSAAGPLLSVNSAEVKSSIFFDCSVLSGNDARISYEGNGNFSMFCAGMPGQIGTCELYGESVEGFQSCFQNGVTSRTSINCTEKAVVLRTNKSDQSAACEFTAALGDGNAKCDNSKTVSLLLNCKKGAEHTSAINGREGSETVSGLASRENASSSNATQPSEATSSVSQTSADQAMLNGTTSAPVPIAKQPQESQESSANQNNREEAGASKTESERGSPNIKSPNEEEKQTVTESNTQEDLDKEGTTNKKEVTDNLQRESDGEKSTAGRAQMESGAGEKPREKESQKDNEPHAVSDVSKRSSEHAAEVIGSSVISPEAKQGVHHVICLVVFSAYINHL